MWCDVVCDTETSKMRRPWPRWAAAPQGKKEREREIKQASGTEPEGRISRKVVLTNPCKFLLILNYSIQDYVGI
jgi:hypothetical protein